MTKGASVEIQQRVAAALPVGDVVTLPADLQLKLQERVKVKHTESPSSISNYLMCPLKWYLERHSGAVAREDSEASLIGTFVHRVLEVFYCEPAAERTFELLDETFKTAWDVLKEGDESDGIISSEVIASFHRLVAASNDADKFRGRFFRRSKEAIDNISKFDAEPSRVKVLATEKWLSMMVGKIKINGKADRIVASLNGDEIIQDWKSGNSKGMNADLLDPIMVPVGLYALMRMMENAKDPIAAKVLSVQLIYLASSPEPARRRVAVTDELLAQTEELVRQVASGMQAAVTEGILVARRDGTAERGPCSWCPAQATCPAWTSGDWTPLREKLGI